MSDSDAKHLDTLMKRVDMLVRLALLVLTCVVGGALSYAKLENDNKQQQRQIDAMQITIEARGPKLNTIDVKLGQIETSAKNMEKSIDEIKDELRGKR